MFKYLLAPFLFSVMMNVKYLKIVNIFIIWNGILSSHECMYVCMYGILLFVSTSPHSRKKHSNNKILSCLLTYVDYLMHLVHLEYLLRRCCYLTVKKLFWLLLFFFPFLYHIEAGEWDRHTKKRRNEKSRLAVATTSTSHTFR